jgi:ATP-binding cassette subfamily C protein
MAVVALQALAGLAENLSLVSLLPIIQTLISGDTADSGLGAIMAQIVGFFGMPPVLESFLVLAIGAATVKAAISISTVRYANHVVLRTSTNLRQDLARRLYQQPWPNLSKLGSGQVVTSVVSEIERIRPAFGQFISLFTGAIQALIYIATSFFVSTPLTLAAIALGVSKIVLLRPLQRRGRDGGRQLSHFTSGMNATLVESLQNMKMLKAMGRENILLGRFIRQSQTHREAADKIAQSAAWLKVLDEYLTALLLAGTFFLSATVLNVGIAEIAVIGVLLNRLLTQIGGLQKSIHTIATQSGAIEAVERCLNEWPQTKPVIGGQKLQFQEEIRLEDLTTGHDDKPVLRNASLVLTAGRLYALVGPSGSGKTTLVDTVLGLHEPLGGRVLIDGADLRQADIAAWHSRIGYMPQELVLFNDTVLFNLLLGSEDLTEEDAKQALIAAEAWDFVQSLPQGLLSVIAERGANLSGGQRQRLALARALIHAKDLLIVDEATTALDHATEIEICRTLRGLIGRFTIIAISHQSAIIDFADEVVKFEHGNVHMVSANDFKKQSERLPGLERANN